MKTELNDTEPVVPADLAELLEQTPPVTQDDLARLEAAAKALDDDPAFQADSLKSLFVENLLAAMEELHENQNQLAQRWGKSRQYVSKLFNEDKRVNFTIETMAELAHLLGRRLVLQVLSPGEHGYVMRCQPTRDRFVMPEDEWDKPTQIFPLNVIAQYRGGMVPEKTVKPIVYDTDLAA